MSYSVFYEGRSLITVSSGHPNLISDRWPLFTPLCVDVRGHEKVRGFGRLMSALVATRRAGSTGQRKKFGELL
jgi:hypothetical protein